MAADAVRHHGHDLMVGGGRILPNDWQAQLHPFVSATAHYFGADAGASFTSVNGLHEDMSSYKMHVTLKSLNCALSPFSAASSCTHIGIRVFQAKMVP